MTDKWKDGYKEGRVRFSCTKLYEEHRVEFWLDRTNIYSVRTEPAGLDDQLVAYLVARAIKSLFKKNTKTKLVEPLHPDLGVLQLRYSIHGARDHHCKKLPQPPRQLEGTDLVFHDPESIYGAQPCCFKCDQSMAPDGLNTSIKLMKPGAGERPCWLAAVRVKCNNGEYCAGRTGGLRGGQGRAGQGERGGGQATWAGDGGTCAFHYQHHSAHCFPCLDAWRLGCLVRPGPCKRLRGSMLGE